MYEQHLASVVENIVEEDGIFYIFIKMWSNFCKFEVGQLVQTHK